MYKLDLIGSDIWNSKYRKHFLMRNNSKNFLCILDFEAIISTDNQGIDLSDLIY